MISYSEDVLNSLWWDGDVKGTKLLRADQIPFKLLVAGSFLLISIRRDTRLHLPFLSSRK